MTDDKHSDEQPDQGMPEAPKIEFPCDYPLHVIGDNDRSLEMRVLRIVQVHAPELDTASVTLNDSSGGRYRAVRLTIRATGVPQLEALHRDLMADPLVRMVL